jgi:hypothetical protein
VHYVNLAKSIDTHWIEWIENSINAKHIKYYEYDDFNDVSEIGSKLAGKMYKASWKRNESCIALKSFSLDNTTVKEIVHLVCINILTNRGVYN